MGMNIVVRDLGALTGSVLLFGGCYSNLHATRALFSRADELTIPASNMICTGDTVAYCADARETVELIQSANCAVVAGNVEKQLASNADDCGCGFEEGTVCDLLSVGWYAHANRQVGTSARNWMAALPDVISFNHLGKRYAVIHGGISDISKFIWSVSPDAEIEHEIELITDRIGQIDCVIAGHSGVAFERQVNGVAWINAGVIGMPPHNGRSTTEYMILDDGAVTLHCLEYDFESAAVRMEALGLDQGYQTALRTGIWPSEDVLPEELRR